MEYLQKIIFALAVLVLPTSCIKEDMADCDNVTIYFQYLADGDTDVLYQYMSKIDLYVFDESGHIMGVGTYNEDELKRFAAIPSFKLRPGQRYKVVAVGNAYDATKVVNLDATSFSDIYLQSPEWENGADNRVTNHDNNYLGQLEFTMPDQEGVMYRDTVTLYSAHINVDIEIYGLPVPPSRQSEEIPYELSIENSNAQCSFNNEINTDKKGTIYPDLIYDYDKQCYRTNDFVLFRMDDWRNGYDRVEADYCSHTLVLREKGAPEGAEPLFTGEFYNYITGNAQIEELVVRQEAVLPIELQFHNLEGSITIPDWVIVDGQPDWN